MSIVPVHHRFSVGDYEQMVELAILTEHDHVELIHGEILAKMTVGNRHAACVKRLNRLLGRLVGDRALVSVQDPIRLSDSEPEPDLALLRPRDDCYEAGKPLASDVMLVIEVADTTLDYDREVKRAMYAEAGIQQYWIVNLVDDCVEVFSQPQADGDYRDMQSCRCDQTVEISTLPGVTVAVARIF